MRWSWNVGRIAGVDVRIHATFLILLAWVAASHALGGQGGPATLAAVLLVLAVFGLVVLHELGHALVARTFGIRTLDITLLPIGGIARVERVPENPRHELLVALSGPAVNLVLAAVLFLLLWASGRADALRAGPGFVVGALPETLFWINLALALFNLLPAFPMDGGRALRALLALRVGRLRATAMAARLGLGMALLMGAIGLVLDPMLLFIAGFVWLGAAQEEASSHVRGVLEGIPVGRVLSTDPQRLSPGEPLRMAVDFVLHGVQRDFPVFEGDRLVGMLTHADLLRGLEKRGDRVLVGEVMQREFSSASSAESLSSAYQRLQDRSASALPVVQDGRFVGMVTMEGISELVDVQDALHTRASATTA